MPALFLAHGSPMNALESNAFTATLSLLGKKIPKPRAILIVSAHWETDGSFVLQSKQPPTIHDFYGFPQQLFQMQYPAPSDEALALEMANTLHIKTTSHWGFDHGVWSLLVHMYPEAHIPVIPLSLDRKKTPEEHFFFAKKLAYLREKNILIIGSGNIVHNLRAIDRETTAKPYSWALQFDHFVKEAILAKDFTALCDYEKRAGCCAELSVPSAEHYLPLLYIAGVADGEDISFPYEGFQNASLSMRCMQYG